MPIVLHLALMVAAARRHLVLCQATTSGEMVIFSNRSRGAILEGICKPVAVWHGSSKAQLHAHLL
jgi:hypothetical protein